MRSYETRSTVVTSLLAVAALFAGGCPGGGGGGGGGGGNENENANVNVNDNTPANTNDNLDDNANVNLNENIGENVNDNDDGGGPVVALVATAQGFGVVTFDDAALLDGVDIPASAALELGTESNVFRSRDSVVSATGVLLIASESNDTIAIYDRFLSAAGTRPPDREVTGPNSDVDSPLSLAIDADNDVLYLVNNSDEFIYVFENVSSESFDGEVEPSRFFTRDTGTLVPDQIFFAEGSLYVVDDDEIIVFEDDGTLEGLLGFDRLITSGVFNPAIRLNISVDSFDRLVVATNSNQVLVFNGASSLDGSPIPDLTLTIQDSSGLRAAVIDSFDTLYALDNDDGAIYVIDGVSELTDGLFFPDRTIESPQFRGGDRMFLFEHEE